MPRSRSLIILCLATALLGACAGGAPVVDFTANGKQPVEYLDEQSGATVTAMDKPLGVQWDAVESLAKFATTESTTTVTAKSIARTRPA